MEQLSLFETIAPVYTTIGNAAEQLQVSTATIRNWIKEDLFELSESKKLLSQESITQFKENRVGKDKLNSRANKKNKDYHNHQKLTSKIESEISKGNFIGNDLCVEYENALSDSYKNREGIFYTPSYIVERMLQSIDTTENKLFLEPCCGCGNFIIAAIQKGIDPQNVYGFDTDVNAVRITQKRIYDLTGYHSDKIVCANFLDIAKKMPQRFDYIFTNPPWGKKISKQAKDNYAKIYEAEESNDTCSLFFFACTKLLKEKGKLGFLLPEAFFNVAQFEKARKKALSFHIERITDYGKFGNLLTRAQSIILTNEQIFQKIVCEKEDKSYTRDHESFFHLPKHIINFYTTDFDATIVDYIYSIPHKTLRNNASWALGIVTGDNKNICKKEHGKGLVPIICGKDITKEGLKQPTLFIDERLEHCQQTAPRKYYLAEEKIIYRFISDKLTFYCDKGKNYILNSANLLIIDQNFPISSEQLVDLLNSELMTWLFQSIFRTHKILRSDLEQLPIFCDYFKQHNIFCEKFFLNYLNLEKKDGTYRIKKSNN